MTDRRAGPVRGFLVGSLVLFLAAAGTPARAQFVPYFGKNNIHYDKFRWQIYTTDHFEIYYYPALAPHLERIAGYAESAYQQISADLKHDLSFKVQLILFKTHSEFEQENIDPGAAQEGCRSQHVARPLRAIEPALRVAVRLQRRACRLKIGRRMQSCPTRVLRFV